MYADDTVIYYAASDAIGPKKTSEVYLSIKWRSNSNRVPFYKYLGIYLEQSLSFKEHVTRLNNTISSQP